MRDLRREVAQMVLAFYEKDVAFEDTVITEAGHPEILSAKEQEKVTDALATSIQLGLIQGLTLEDLAEMDGDMAEAAAGDVIHKIFHLVVDGYVAYATAQLMLRGDILPLYYAGEFRWVPTSAIPDYLQEIEDDYGS